MGRKTTVNLNLPRGMRARVRTRKHGQPVVYYYYDTGSRPRKEIPLGKDYVLAVQEWARLEAVKCPQNIATFNQLAARYQNEILIHKKAGTQNTYTHALKHLREFFGNPDAPLEQIQPQHISQYLEWRKATPTGANMEIAVFRAIWNQARAWGYTDKASPTQNIKTHTLTGRKNVYIDDHLYKFVYRHADTDMRDLMDIAYITGQRPIDIVSIHSHHIHNGVLHITQVKTGSKLRFQITGDLAEIINRRNSGGYLFTGSQGKALTRTALTARFNKLRKKLAAQYPEMAAELENFQFRDLRAKSGTDIYLTADTEAAKAQLGHSSPEMTKKYIRQEKVLQPLNRK